MFSVIVNNNGGQTGQVACHHQWLTGRITWGHRHSEQRHFGRKLRECPLPFMRALLARTFPVDFIHFPEKHLLCSCSHHLGLFEILVPPSQSLYISRRLRGNGPSDLSCLSCSHASQCDSSHSVLHARDFCCRFWFFSLNLLKGSLYTLHY